MKASEIRVLLVEDNEDDYVRTRWQLAEIAEGRYQLEWVSDYQQGLEVLGRGQHDVCLVDHYLGGRVGLDFLREPAVTSSRVPILILTGSSDRQLDLDSMRSGAADYLVKGEITPPILERAIRYAIERGHTLERLRASEERYAIAIEGTHEGIWDWDLQRDSVFFAPRWKAMLGLSDDAVTGKAEDWFGRVHPEDLDGLQAAIAQHRDGATPHFESEHRMLHRDGSYRWMLSRGVAVRDSHGKATRMAGSQTDITERQEACARLAESLAEVARSHGDMLSILNRLRVGSAMTDPEGRITFLSEVSRDILGASEGEALGRPWADLWPLGSEDRARLVEMAGRPPAARTKVSLHFESRRGRAYWVEVEVHDDPRDPQRKIFFLYDVTEVQDLRRLLDDRSHYLDLVGKSEPMKRVYQLIQEVGAVDSTVLIEGETGTGKELAARALHASSHRKAQPFVAVNCAGLTESLLGSQLFGHKRGAFTGAVEDHQGLFEAANGGTIFLDEIGDVPMGVQTNLLRVLQEREILRVGESKPRHIDVRVLAASHQNLEALVDKGTFRLDLLYRIRVIRITLPPLRDRRQDIPLLAAAFLAKLRAATGKDVDCVSTEALGVLMSQPWRGNVRELQSAIEFAVIRCKGPVIQLRDLPPELLEPSRRGEPEIGMEIGDEPARLKAALERAKGNRTAAARLLGVSRATFYRRLTEFGMGPGEADRSGDVGRAEEV